MNINLFRTSLAGVLIVSTLAAATADRPAIVTKDGSFTLIDVPDSTSTQVWAINSRGEMVGVYVSAGVTHGFLLSGGRFQTIDYPGAALTFANGINAQGDIVGEYATTPTGPHHGFILSGGRFTTIDFPGSTSSAIVGIAANGDVVGGYNSPARGFLVSAGTFTSIDYPGATSVVTGSMSPQGDVVGSYTLGGVVTAFVLRNGEFTAWNHPNAAGGFTNAIGRNAAGDTVGRYLDSARVSHGYLLSNGQFTSFDYPGATFTGAAGISPEGDIVGRCTVGGVTHGFLLKRGQSPRYRVTDLGTFGGKMSHAYGVSNAGVVTGDATTANGDFHPFLWRDGKMTDLGSLGGTNGSGNNPNGSLQVAIVSEIAGVDPLGADFCGYGTHRMCRAAIWKDGRMTQFPTLGGNNALGFGVNERGQMVGSSEKSTRDSNCAAPQVLAFSPVIWGPNAGDIQELRLPTGDTVGWAYGINDKGESVGATGACTDTYANATGLLYGARAVLWENGVPRDLGTLGSKTNTLAVGINNRTEIVGSSGLADESGVHGFLWSRENGLEDIGALGSDLGLISSINNARQVTGASCDADFNCRTILWERYNMTDLNDLVAEDSSIYMVFGTWINDVGEIAGWGIDKQTEEVRAFLASPVKAAAAGAKSYRPARVLPESVRHRLREEMPAARVASRKYKR